MNGDQLCAIGWPTTPYRSTDPPGGWEAAGIPGFYPAHRAAAHVVALRRAGRQYLDARAPLVPNIEVALQLGQPHLHTLGKQMGRVHDQHSGPVEREARIARIKP